MQLILQIFEDERRNRIRSIKKGDEPWFVGNDVCAALGLTSPRTALATLDDDERDAVGITDAIGRRQTTTVVSESGLYSLIFKSKKPEAKRFKKWVTSEVLPQLRRTGTYSSGAAGLPNFVRRFNDNWSRTEPGYFSVISELYIRLYGRFEQVGYVIPDKARDGKEIRPDNSVGQLFSKWIKKNHPSLVGKRKTYSHLLPEGFAVEAYQYPNEMLALFIEYVDRIWLPERGPAYFQGRDAKALDYLPRLLPPSEAA